MTGTTTGGLVGANAGDLDVFVRKYNADGGVLWTRQFGTGGSDYVYAIAVDAAGRAIVAGSVYGSLAGSLGGEADAFVRKYDADGGEVWTRQFGTSEFDEAFGVAVDGAGHVYVVGGTAGDLEGSSTGSADAFVRTYDADGGVLWTRQFGTSDGELAWHVAVDAVGQVLVAGFTFGAWRPPPTRARRMRSCGSSTRPAARSGRGSSARVHGTRRSGSRWTPRASCWSRGTPMERWRARTGAWRTCSCGGTRREETGVHASGRRLGRCRRLDPAATRVGHLPVAEPCVDPPTTRGGRTRRARLEALPGPHAAVALQAGGAEDPVDGVAGAPPASARGFRIGSASPRCHSTPCLRRLVKMRKM
jgi:hypothetical protein